MIYSSVEIRIAYRILPAQLLVVETSSLNLIKATNNQRLSTEVLTLIFIYLHFKQKLECKLVCKKWLNILSSGFELETIRFKLREENNYDSFINKIQAGSSAYRRHCKRLLLNAPFYSSYQIDYLFIAKLFSNLTYFSCSGGGRDMRIHNTKPPLTESDCDQLQQWRDNIQTIVLEHMGVQFLLVLDSGVFNSLKTLELKFGLFSHPNIKKSQLTKLLKNTPHITKFVLTCFTVDIYELEDIHSTLNKLVTFGLHVGEVTTENVLPDNIRPPKSLKSLHFYCHLPRITIEQDAFKYLVKKYSEIDHFKYAVEEIKKLSLEEYLTANLGLNKQYFSHMFLCGAHLKIRVLKLSEVPPVNVSQFKRFPELKVLELNFKEKKGIKCIFKLGSMINHYLPSKLESISLDYAEVHVDPKQKEQINNYITELKLNRCELAIDLASFIAQRMKKLSVLHLLNCNIGFVVLKKGRVVSMQNNAVFKLPEHRLKLVKIKLSSEFNYSTTDRCYSESYYIPTLLKLVIGGKIKYYTHDFHPLSAVTRINSELETATLMDHGIHDACEPISAVPNRKYFEFECANAQTVYLNDAFLQQLPLSLVDIELHNVYNYSFTGYSCTEDYSILRNLKLTIASFVMDGVQCILKKRHSLIMIIRLQRSLSRVIFKKNISYFEFKCLNMINLSTEILTIIFTFLHYEQKARCMFVCKKWANILCSGLDLETIVIPFRESEKFDSLMFKVKTSGSNYGKKCKRLVVQTSYRQYLDYMDLAVNFPNLTQLFLHGSEQYEYFTPKEPTEAENKLTQPWKDNLCYLKNDGFGQRFLDILDSGIFNSLTKLELAPGFGKFLHCSKLFERIKGAPHVTDLVVKYINIDISDLELLHRSLTKLTSLVLNHCQIESKLDISTTVQPASSLKSLKLLRPPFYSFNLSASVIQYLTTKYTHLDHFALTELSRFAKHDIEKVTNQTISLLRGIGQRLTNLNFDVPCRQLSALELFSTMNLKSFSINLSMSKQMFRLLGSLQGFHHIETLKLTEVPLIEFSVFHRFTELKRLELAFKEKKGAKATIYLTNILDHHLPKKLESLGLAYVELHIHKNKENPDFKSDIKELKLKHAEVSIDLASFLTQHAKKLDTLYFHDCKVGHVERKGKVMVKNHGEPRFELLEHRFSYISLQLTNDYTYSSSGMSYKEDYRNPFRLKLTINENTQYYNPSVGVVYDWRETYIDEEVSIRRDRTLQPICKPSRFNKNAEYFEFKYSKIRNYDSGLHALCLKASYKLVLNILYLSFILTTFY
ncbi:hypothetical protein K501DRAFT_315927 [Backusella circina FSU 941]|nr:hypothetical protein K501DRAFT_315927 [Backusella circina FSU 941]